MEPNLQPDFREAQQTMERVAAQVLAPDQQAFQEIGAYAGGRIRAAFDHLKPALAAATIEDRLYGERRGLVLAGSLGQPLVRGGELREAASADHAGVAGADVKVTGVGFFNTVTLVQARILRLGGATGQDDHTKIPARDYADFDQKDEDAFAAILSRLLASRINTAG